MDFLDIFPGEVCPLPLSLVWNISKFEVQCKFQLNVRGKIPFMAPELNNDLIDKKQKFDNNKYIIIKKGYN